MCYCECVKFGGILLLLLLVPELKGSYWTANIPWVPVVPAIQLHLYHPVCDRINI